MQLATVYAPPGVVLLMTSADGKRSGCVGLQSLGMVEGVRTGEMRRLFVREENRGKGAGRGLVETLISHARAKGFGRIVLNTLPAMTSAHALYKSFGFQPSEPHVVEPAEGTLYFSLDLIS